MELHDAPTNHSVDAWKKFRDGDFSSLGALFEKHYLELFYYGNKIVALPEMVKDTIQDLFIGVWERRSKMSGVENIKAYLIISLRRELMHRLDKARKENTNEELFNLQFSFSPEDFLISSEQNQENTHLLSKSMEGLTDRQREVIILRFYHNLEFAEISQVLEMNVQSVRNLLFRALEKIRKDMSDQGVTGIGNVEMFLWLVFGQKK
jgi:RNA polymerase sigma factor (sigma-70 family)